MLGLVVRRGERAVDARVVRLASAVLRDVGVTDAQDLESCTLVVPSAPCKSLHSLQVPVCCDGAQRYSSLPGIRQVLKP